MEDTSPYLDINVKAICLDPLGAEQVLLKCGAMYQGLDNQVDTFYEVETGMLKYRKGNIEHLITHYIRELIDGEVYTRVFVYERNPSQEIIDHLLSGRKVIAEVTKQRKIFFIDNVKFHIDRLEGGDYVEIEAMTRDGLIPKETLTAQARRYMEILGIREEHVINDSYVNLKA